MGFEEEDGTGQGVDNGNVGTKGLAQIDFPKLLGQGQARLQQKVGLHNFSSQDRRCRSPVPPAAAAAAGACAHASIERGELRPHAGPDADLVIEPRLEQPPHKNLGVGRAGAAARLWLLLLLLWW